MTLHPAALIPVAQVLDCVADACLLVDAQQRVLHLNGPAQAMMGTTSADAVGRPIAEVLPLDSPPDGAWKSGQQYSLRAAWGGTLPVELRKQPLGATDGAPLATLWLLRNVTEQFAYAATLEHLSGHDARTGLYNRKALEDRATQALELARRYKRVVGVVVLRVEGLERILRRLGDEVAQALLRETAVRMRTVLRRSDAAGLLTEDSFAALLTELADAGHVAVAAQKALALCTAPVDVGGTSYQLPLRLGTATYPSDGEDGRALLALALSRTEV